MAGAADRGAQRIAVVPHGTAGAAVQPLTDDGAPAGAAQVVPSFADAVLAAPPATRWVWTATATVYPALLAAGVRVDRCHDVWHTESLLRLVESRWDEALDTVDPLADVAGASGRDQPTLFDDAPAPDAPALDAGDALDALVAEHADQVARISALRKGTPGLALLVAAESASTLAAAEMGHVGLPWDGAVHDEILTALLGPRPAAPVGSAGAVRPPLLQAAAEQVAAALEAPGLNPDSPAELLRALRRAGLPVTSTRSWELRRHEHPAVPLVRRYKELARLWTANGWAWRDAWVRDGRFRPEYVVGGVVSGRWATRGGGALQIPKAVRGAVRAQPGRCLVVADAGQLEPRVLAALSRDPGMVAATRAPDLYADLAANALGRPEARADAKLGLLAAMYGGGGGSPAMAALRARYPQALALLEEAARTGEAGGAVRSVLGRVCPPAPPSWLSGLPDAVAAERSRARGRFTRNFVVQASAADWAAVLVAGLRTRLAALPAPPGPDGAGLDGEGLDGKGLVGEGLGGDGWRAQLVFFQHDEVIVEAPSSQADLVVAAIGEAGTEATRLVLGDVGVHVPLTAAVVDSYADKG